MPENYLANLFRKYRAKGILPDTNILLVLLVGSCSRTLIRGFKRTREYSTGDFDLLVQVFAQFNRVVTTPGVLTEVNSLANQLQGRYKADFYIVFRKYIATMLQEEHRPARAICDHVFYSKCGLSDAAILSVAEDGLLVLTDDGPLTAYLQARNVDCITLDLLRSHAGGGSMT